MKEWHEPAKRLYADGVSLRQIVRAFQKSEATVRYVLDIDGAKEKNRERVRRQRIYIWNKSYLANA